MTTDDEEYAVQVLNFDTIGGAIEFRYSTAQIKDEAVQKGPER